LIGERLFGFLWREGARPAAAFSTGTPKKQRWISSGCGKRRRKTIGEKKTTWKENEEIVGRRGGVAQRRRVHLVAEVLKTGKRHPPDRKNWRKERRGQEIGKEGEKKKI